MSTAVQDAKTQSESVSMVFDFLSRCQQGENVVTCVVAIGVFSGTDPSPSSMLDGSPSVSYGTVVTQKVKAGLPGVIYQVSCSARTSLNNIYINQVKLAVLSDNAATPPALP